MKYITLADLKNMPDVRIINMPEPAEMRKTIRGISIDSRSLKANQVFWALKGPNFDGHDFMQDAIRQGAIALVIDKTNIHRINGTTIPVFVVPDSLPALQQLAAEHRRNFSIPVLAITGTNGKTTTKEMIAWILQTRMNVHRTWGNHNNHIGVPLTLLSMNSEHDFSIVELGTNHPGEIAMLSRLVNPTAGMITNIGRGHLEFFSDIRGVAREKTELLNSISPEGTIFLNLDDPNLLRFYGREKTVVSFSMTAGTTAAVKGKLIRMDDDGNGIWQLNDHTRIKLQVPGIHNVRNALAASAVALHYGFTEEEIRDSLERFLSYDKRMQIVKNGDVMIINDTYNANPDSYLPALETLQHIASRHNSRKIVVFGDMLELGLKSEALHQELMFNLLDFNIDALFTLGEYSALGARLLKERGFDKIYSFRDHQALAQSLKKYLHSGDIILLKGSRGMQVEKILAYL
jgi:UDP-N-acetylmuramoyl-tripeptide--D-alanyl-D-alanine ligase